MAEKAILFDSSKCSGCKACQVACKCWNLLPSTMEKNTQEWSGSLQNPSDLNSNTRIIMTFRENPREQWGVDWAFGRRSCMHCTDAGCVTVCPSGALYYHETGMVTYDADKCIGCEYCRSACPFNVPRHANRGGGFSTSAVINKCTGCVDRVAHDMKPACVTTCQPGALDFGDRDEMLATAHERVEYLHEKGFADARVYGETEVGGTHVIYVLKYAIDMYELPENPSIGGVVAGSDFLKPLTAVGTVAIVAGLGLCYVLGVGYRRDQLRYDEELHEVIDVDTGEVVKRIDVEAGER